MNKTNQIEKNRNDFVNFLNVLSFWIDTYNLYLNEKAISNDEIMKELDKQDNVYFEKIIKLLEEIKGEKNDSK